MSFSHIEHRHNSLFYHLKPSQFFRFMMSSVLRIAAMSLIGIFSSVYVYESALANGKSHINALLIVVVFYILIEVTKYAFLYIGEKASIQKGFKFCIWLSGIPFILFIPSIIFGGNNLFLILIAGILLGGHAGLYWWGYHGYFVKAGDSKHYGEGIGKITFLQTTASVAAPILGGISISIFGFSSIYVIAFALICVSLLILGTDHDYKQKHDTSIQEVADDASRHPLSFLSLISRGMSQQTYGVFWALYLFLLFNSAFELGAITSVSLLFAAFAVMFIGKYNDKHGEIRAILFASPILSIAWVLRYFVFTVAPVVVANSMASFSGQVVHVSIDELMYKKANREHTAEALLYRELGIVGGMLGSLITAGMFILILGDFKPVFLVAALTSTLPIFYVINHYGRSR